MSYELRIANADSDSESSYVDNESYTDDSSYVDDESNIVDADNIDNNSNDDPDMIESNRYCYVSKLFDDVGKYKNKIIDIIESGEYNDVLSLPHRFDHICGGSNREKEKTVKFFLDSGYNIFDLENYDPLESAISMRLYRHVKLLLDDGRINPNNFSNKMNDNLYIDGKRRKIKKTYLMHACNYELGENKKILPVVKLIAEDLRVDVTITDECGNNALHYACNNNLTSVIRYFSRRW